MDWQQVKDTLAAMNRKPTWSDRINWFINEKIFRVPYYPEDHYDGPPNKEQ